jgi:hypothetical protein
MTATECFGNVTVKLSPARTGTVRTKTAPGLEKSFAWPIEFALNTCISARGATRVPSTETLVVSAAPVSAFTALM